MIEGEQEGAPPSPGGDGDSDLDLELEALLERPPSASAEGAATPHGPHPPASGLSFQFPAFDVTIGAQRATPPPPSAPTPPESKRLHGGRGEEQDWVAGDEALWETVAELEGGGLGNWDAGLPQDVLERVLGHLGVPDSATVSMVCRQWREGVEASGRVWRAARAQHLAAKGLELPGGDSSSPRAIRASIGAQKVAAQFSAQIGPHGFLFLWRHLDGLWHHDGPGAGGASPEGGGSGGGRRGAAAERQKAERVGFRLTAAHWPTLYEGLAVLFRYRCEGVRDDVLRRGGGWGAVLDGWGAYRHWLELVAARTSALNYQVEAERARAAGSGQLPDTPKLVNNGICHFRSWVVLSSGLRRPLTKELVALERRVAEAHTGLPGEDEPEAAASLAAVQRMLQEMDVRDDHTKGPVLRTQPKLRRCFGGALGAAGGERSRGAGVVTRGF